MVDGGNIAVADAMDAGSKSKAEVSLEFTTNPDDATLSFEPALKDYNATSKSGKWALSVGENSIKIIVAKDGNTKEYTLKVKRVGDEEPLLKSLKVDGEDVSIREAPDIMEARTTSKASVEVTYQCNTGSNVSITPALDSGKWNLVFGANTLKIKVTKGSKTRNYTLRIVRDANAPTSEPVLTVAFVNGHSLDILDEMEAGKTTGSEANVLFATNPTDATLTFTPALKTYDEKNKQGKWALYRRK